MNNKKTLVFGASLKSERYSNMAILSLVKHGWPAVAFGLREGIVAGVPIDTELKSYTEIDTISLYLKPERQVDYYEYFLSLKPKRVLFNPGTYNAELIALLEQNNIMTEVACSLVLLGTNQY